MVMRGERERERSRRSMGRGKMEMKMIENPTSRQVTYSKRRSGIFKKAEELTVLCDAQVSVIIFSNTGKFHEFISPSLTTKKIYDQYQKALGIDLWSKHYEKMRENLRKLEETNNNLRRQISEDRQKIGDELSDLSYEEMQRLEQTMSSSLDLIRQRKYHAIKTQTETYRKKVRHLEERHCNMLLHCEAKHNESDLESAAEMGNGAIMAYDIHLA